MGPVPLRTVTVVALMGSNHVIIIYKRSRRYRTEELADDNFTNAAAIIK